MSRQIASAFLLLSLLAGCGGTSKGGGSADSAAAGTAQAQGELTEDDVKSVLGTVMQAKATGGSYAPSSVDLDFQSVEIAPARPRGADDEINGVKSAEVYPVRVRYTETDHWSDGTSRSSDTAYGYLFHRDDFGNWASLGTGPI